MSWETVIGLEVHVQLQTVSKIFSGSATAYGAAPNTQACAIDLGFPGVLPVLNQKALHMALQFGLAIGAELPQETLFARKNYFYPDLPKGYQISQLEAPVVGRGHLDINTAQGTRKRIGITRAHLEEDAGKSVHTLFADQSAIDLNRAGTPLLEVVSEPELSSPAEAVSYLKTLYTLVDYLKICDGNLQEGSFRVDANVSIRPSGSTTLGTRTEIKNVNSFRYVEKALQFEIARHIAVLSSGGEIVQETRLYNPEQDVTKVMRSKEEAHDYRYFPDPDLLPIPISAALLTQLRADLPELPDQRQQRFQDEMALGREEALNLVQNRALADHFEALVKAGISAKLAANWLSGEFTAWINKSACSVSTAPVTTDQLIGLLQRVEDQTISLKIAKTVFAAIWHGEGDADSVIQAQNLRQVTDDGAIADLCAQVLRDNPEQVAQWRAGKDKVFGFLVGQVMKLSKGKANPQQVNALLKAKLSPE